MRARRPKGEPVSDMRACGRQLPCVRPCGDQSALWQPSNGRVFVRPKRMRARVRRPTGVRACMLVYAFESSRRAWSVHAPRCRATGTPLSQANLPAARRAGLPGQAQAQPVVVAVHTLKLTEPHPLSPVTPAAGRSKGGSNLYTEPTRRERRWG